MSFTTQVYEKSSTDMMKYSALIIVLAQVIGFGLSFLTSYYIGLIGDLVYAVGLFLLGNAVYTIGMSFPNARFNAKSTRTWLFIYGGSLLFTYIPVVGIVGSLAALVTGIGSFLKLNGLFRNITLSAPQQGKLNSWVFPAYALYGILSSVVLIIAAVYTIFTLGLLLGFLLILTYVIIGGSILLSFALAYVLYQNSVKLERIRESTDFSRLTPSPIPGTYMPVQPTPAPITYAPVQPIQPGSEEQGIKHCSNCGSKLLASDKFCPSCGASIS